jgi:hypothetical protein
MMCFSKISMVLFLVASSAVFSQQTRTTYVKKVNTNATNSTRVNLYGSYAFEDSFDSYYDYGNYYQGQLQDGFLYGAGIEFEVKPSFYIEAQYLRQDTNAPTQYYNGGLYNKFSDFDVAMNYIMLGGNKSFRKAGSSIEGFGGAMAGLAVINIDDPKGGFSDDVTKFAWGLKGGMIAWVSDNVGLKFQAQLLSVTQSVGGGMFIGTGGLGAGVSSYSSIYQFSLGGGLVFELAK